jgi:hypothetical protein
MAWMRRFDSQGRLLPYGRDEARQERWEKELAQLRAEQERQAREQAERQVQRLTEQLRALGVEPSLARRAQRNRAH